MLGSLTSLTGGGGLTGGSAGPSTATNTTNSGQSIGAINMGSPKGVSPWLIAVVIVVIAYLMLKKK
ncbi:MULTISPECIES: hypothetical protein [unclassified Vibrio]|uniref:hypothetical protein n=1 Tax=unclassified Vibrio TaxID=2614977 RepID=UPI000B8E4730|nr:MULTISPECIES: hypothetical protein [unclassified Vibrio]NAW90258.1 hypothetical protein [Vibrio sp. V24_P1S3T111]OXX20402.1 hypothetical protein B9J88_14175 [Vibrio sp. V05_P4A8T149]OXX23360.1 hypothetical protein B9J86_07585 [Vibrio sp. V06_P1A73T115]OXX29146.1 hypothetical protein B9J95_14140 [Vibrio sp. V14_P6S14T42]OXX36384.1 hypothetical protein B9J81_06130 [Vibrio sp. V04_P4A5T148]